MSSDGIQAIMGKPVVNVVGTIRVPALLQIVEAAVELNRLVRQGAW